MIKIGSRKVAFRATAAAAVDAGTFKQVSLISTDERVISTDTRMYACLFRT